MKKLSIYENNGQRYDIKFSTDPYYIKPWYYDTLTEKATILPQRHCPFCTTEGNINITPFFLPIYSSQSNKEKKETIKNSFESFCKEHSLNYSGNEYFCIRIVFFLATGKQHFRDKDLDNMAKLALDLMKNKLFADDKQIHHLDLIKIFHSGKRDFMKIRIQECDINSNKNVFIINNLDDIIAGYGEIEQ